MGENVRGTIKEYGIGHRHAQTFLVFALTAVIYVMRVSMSVSIVVMTDHSSNKTDSQVFDWDKQTQDYILSGFFWGYMLTQFPAGQLAQKYGAKRLLLGSIFCNSGASMVLPYVANIGGWQTVFAIRMFQGFTQSCLMPCIQTFLSKWAPVSEKSRFGNFLIAGGPFGTIIGMSSVGFLAEWYGWAAAFQVIGVVGIVMGITWFLLGSDSPSQHAYITYEEKTFIEKSLGYKANNKPIKIPWKAMLGSRPLQALLLTQIGCNWGYVMMLLEIPSYLKMGLGIGTQKSGLYSALPYVGLWIFGLILSWLADYCINKNYLTTTAVRKIVTSIATVGQGIGLVILSFIPKNQVLLSVIMLIISISLSSGFNMGPMLNPLDLAPNFAGTIMGLMNGIANLVASMAPITAGYFLNDPSDISQWRMVFLITTGIMVTSNIIFLIFGSGERQSWNDNTDDDIELKTQGPDNEQRNELLKIK